MTSSDQGLALDRVVVTGASGFLGSRVIAALHQRGIPALPLSREAGPTWTQVDDYADSPEGDVLIHLAEDSDRRRVNEQGDAYTAKALGTLKALLEKKYRRIVYASSAVLYGDASASPHEPGDPIQLTDTYSRTKRQSELMVLERRGGVVLRLANLLGPGMSPQNVLSTILAQVPGEGEVSLWDAAPVRDFLWIDDAAAGLVAVARGEATGIYNLGSGVAHSIGEIARMALDLAGQGHREIRSTQPAGRISHLALAIGATLRDFGWMPETALKDGIGRLISSKLTPQ